IDMLDFANVVAVNKFERRGAEDARRDVARQLVRNRGEFGVPWEDMPVFGTSAARFDDDGVTALYQHLRGMLAEQGLRVNPGALPVVSGHVSTGLATMVPPNLVTYLADVAETVRDYHEQTALLADLARRRHALTTAAAELQSAASADAGAAASADAAAGAPS